MDVQELMKPRYILENLWPGCQWAVGAIFPINFGEFHKYPYLFRKLEWWEERNDKDMPLYLKYSDKFLNFYHCDDSFRSVAFKVKEYDNMDSSRLSVFDVDNKMGHHGIGNYIPATEFDYNPIT